MSYFLKLIGTTEDPLPVNWMKDRPEVVNGVRFGGENKPPPRKGDMIIYYAVGRQRLCGLLEVISEEPTRDNPQSEPWTQEQKFRWPWWLGLKPILLLEADERAPHVDEVGFEIERVKRKSFLQIGAGEFKKMEEAIRAKVHRPEGLKGR
jgi:hypothetical protein